MVPPSGAGSNARATVAVNSVGVIDLLQIAAAGLQPGQEYQLLLVDSLTKPDATHVGLTKFTANPSGAAIAQAIGPLRTVVAAPGAWPVANLSGAIWFCWLPGAISRCCNSRWAGRRIVGD